MSIDHTYAFVFGDITDIKELRQLQRCQLTAEGVTETVHTASVQILVERAVRRKFFSASRPLKNHHF